VALDKRTGAELWRTHRRAQVSWATPLLVRHRRLARLIVAGAEHIISYAPQTGQEIWRAEGVRAGYSTPAVPSPVADEAGIYVTTGFNIKRAIAIRLDGAANLTAADRIRWHYNKGTGQ